MWFKKKEERFEWPEHYKNLKNPYLYVQKKILDRESMKYYTGVVYVDGVRADFCIYANAETLECEEFLPLGKRDNPLYINGICVYEFNYSIDKKNRKVRRITIPCDEIVVFETDGKYNPILKEEENG